MENEINDTVLEQGKEEPEMNSEDTLRLLTAQRKLDTIVELAETQNIADSFRDSETSKRIFKEIIAQSSGYGTSWFKYPFGQRSFVALDQAVEHQIAVIFYPSGLRRISARLIYRTSGDMWVELPTVRRERNALLRLFKYVGCFTHDPEPSNESTP